MVKDNYLAKWLDGQLDGEDLREFEASEEFAAYQRIAAATEELEIEATFKKEEIWNSLLDQKLRKAGAGDQPVIPLDREVNKAEDSRWNRSRFLKIAASVAILLSVGYFLLMDGSTRITTGAGERELALLPDQSRVTLNAESRIAYNEGKWEEARRLELHGEAFFDVQKGQKFTVQTGMGEVTVLGTQFDVAQREDFFRVICFEGKVAVTYRNNDFVLLPGDSFQVLDGEGALQYKHEQTAPGWMSNRSDFRSVPLGKVLDEIERQYNIRIIREAVPEDKKFTGSFRHDNLKQALEYIAKPSRLDFTIDKGQVRLYGATGQGK